MRDTITEDNGKLPGLIGKYRDESGTIIGLLQDIHESYGYLPEQILQQVSDEVEVPLSTLYSLATFYSSFRLEPMGKHHIKSCVGTACHVKGAPFVVDTIERELGIKSGETTPDGLFTFDTVNCLGACALAPLIVIDNEYYGKVDQNKVKKILDTLRKES
jgi:NADH:ubiquinone oxidoreductase subunit E